MPHPAGWPGKCEMRVYYSDGFAFPLPDGHRFPSPKYALLRQRALESGILKPTQLHLAPPATDIELCRVHAPSYLAAVISGGLSQAEVRRIGLPWSGELVERARRSTGGTIAACRSALGDGVALNLGGGTHHAHAAFGAGFCVFNDVAVAVRAMQAESRLKRALVIDCDVHQGDGTAEIFASDESVFTFSIHGQHNFPFRKAHSDLDIALPDGATDGPYLQALMDGLQQIPGMMDFDLVVYLAGADPFSGDRLGHFCLTKDGLEKRDALVLAHCRTIGLPIAVTLAGGYAEPIDDTVDIHLNTLKCLARLYP
jgi:acetoin utilization deacetylase AcuC-like enzyme